MEPNYALRNIFINQVWRFLHPGINLENYNVTALAMLMQRLSLLSVFIPFLSSLSPLSPTLISFLSFSLPPSLPPTLPPGLSSGSPPTATAACELGQADGPSRSLCFAGESSRSHQRHSCSCEHNISKRLRCSIAPHQKMPELMEVTPLLCRWHCVYLIQTSPTKLSEALPQQCWNFSQMTAFKITSSSSLRYHRNLGYC